MNIIHNMNNKQAFSERQDIFYFRIREKLTFHIFEITGQSMFFLTADSYQHIIFI